MQELDLFALKEEKRVTTPYGPPSSALSCGTFCGVECVLINRHGDGHRVMPTSINYRANVYALKEEGCSHVIATTACGSLKEEIVPGHFVIIDQFIDRTTKRQSTFYDGQPGSLNGICHIPMKQPFCEKLRNILVASCIQENITCHASGTTVTLEGPRFSSYAESHLFRSWGASVVNMTTVPEVILANEMGLLYAAVAMVTDYDCWRDDHESVSVENVLKVMNENREKAIKILCACVKMAAEQEWDVEVNDAKQVAQSSVML